MSWLTTSRNLSTASATKLVLITLLSGATMFAQAVPITGLFNTGVNDSGVALSAGASDTHYAQLAPSQPGIVIRDSIPGSWINNTSSYRWIWENVNGSPVNVTRTYRTTFDLTGLDSATALISGLWASDNFGLDIFINGTSTGNTCGGFSSFCNFSVNSGFISGLNTLDFQVRDVGSISGFLVGSISGSADEITSSSAPEPTTLVLMALGLVGIGISKRKPIIDEV